MVRTRKQLAAEQDDLPVADESPGEPPKDLTTHTRNQQTTQPASKHAECDHTYPSLTDKKNSPRQHNGRCTKRSAGAADHDPSTVPKRPRPSLSDTLAEETSSWHSSIAFWAREGHWPREDQWPSELQQPQQYVDLNMEYILARKRSVSSLSRKRSNSATSMTPSDQRPREEKSTPYKDNRYNLLLQTKGVYLVASEEGIADSSERLIRDLLENDQPIPKGTIFDDDVFSDACRNLSGGQNEARIIQDVSRLIVPSAETLALRAKHLKHLAESVNAGWNNAIALTGVRPQPDYAVGFQRTAFTKDQLTKLSPLIGDFIQGDLSFFMATYYIYFPFLTCEVKCGDVGLDIADRQNAHSMALAVRAVVELFRAVKREAEVHRQVLAFSVSHNHRSVRIYAHYPEIHGKDTTYYRHLIHDFNFTVLNGKEKWTTYRFIRNVYDIWSPMLLRMVCSAIDQLPSDLNFDVPSAPETGPSQGPGNLMQAESAEQSSRPDLAGQTQEATPSDTPLVEPQAAKRKK